MQECFNFFKNARLINNRETVDVDVLFVSVYETKHLFSQHIGNYTGNSFYQRKNIFKHMKRFVSWHKFYLLKVKRKINENLNL